MAERTRRLETKTLKGLANDVVKGYVGLPLLQRDYVQNKQKVLSKVTAVLTEVPLTSLTFGEISSKIPVYEKFRGLSLECNTLNLYALDGQQRIITLVGAYLGKKVEKHDFSKIYINVDIPVEKYNNISEEIVLWKSDVKGKKGTWLPFYQVVNTDHWGDDEVKEFLNKDVTSYKVVNEIMQRYTSYDFAIEIRKYDNLKQMYNTFIGMNSNNTNLTRDDYSLCLVPGEVNVRITIADHITHLKELYPFASQLFKQKDYVQSILTVYANSYYYRKLEELTKADTTGTFNVFLDSVEKAYKFIWEEFNVVQPRLVVTKHHLVSVLTKVFFENYYKGLSDLTSAQRDALVGWYFVTYLFDMTKGGFMSKASASLSNYISEEVIKNPYSCLSYMKYLGVDAPYISEEDFHKKLIRNNKNLNNFQKIVWLNYCRNNPLDMMNGGQLDYTKNSYEQAHLFAQGAYGSQSNNIANFIPLLNTDNNKNKCKNPDVVFDLDKIDSKILKSNFIDDDVVYAFKTNNMAKVIKLRGSAMFKDISINIGLKV